jgi:hypothetical protein
MNESQAEAVVEIIGSASTNLMTKDDAAILRAEIKADAAVLKAEIKASVFRIKADVFRALLWIQGAGIVAIVGTFIAIATALG